MSYLPRLNLRVRRRLTQIICSVAGGRHLRLIGLLLLFWGLFDLVAVHAADLDTSFQQANRLFEEGKFAAAAQAYLGLINQGQVSSALLFNLGNVWLKIGQVGRARACYQLALELNPRDRDIRENLRWLQQNTGPEPGSWLQRLATRLRWFSLNEWTMATVVLLWNWLGMLTAAQFKPKFRERCHLWFHVSLVALGICLLGLGLTVWDRYQAVTAVVVVPEAEVRRGPFAESQVYFNLKDGAAVHAIDEQNGWREIIDNARRSGWIRSDHLLLLKPGLVSLPDLTRLPLPGAASDNPGPPPVPW
jgi:tetratricopeptide (TPR) repeat protein